MTDRHKGYVVTLAQDIREDDAKATINALSMIKGVISVVPVINDAAAMIAEARAANSLYGRLLDLAADMSPKTKPKPDQPR